MKDARGNYTVMKYDVKGNLLEEIKPDAKLGLLSLKAMAKGIQDVFCVQLEPLRFTAKGTSFIRQRCPEAHDWIGISLLTY